VDSLSGTITRTPDILNRLQQEVTPQGTVTYAYDNADRRTSMTVVGQPAVTYGYDVADRLTSLTQGAATVTLGYDDANRRTSLTLPNGVIATYAYSTRDELTNLTFMQGSTTLGTLTYTYDAAGRRATVGGTWARTGLPAAVASATYDDANR
jgi:YD repeat-containing protein